LFYRFPMISVPEGVFPTLRSKNLKNNICKFYNIHFLPIFEHVLLRYNV
jgi:hypothetical protein